MTKTKLNKDLSPNLSYPGDILNPEESDDDIIICSPGQELHGHGAELLDPRLRPVLQAGLAGQERRGGEGRQQVISPQNKSLCQRQVMGKPLTRHLSIDNRYN